MTLVDSGPFDAITVTISGQDPTPVLAADATEIVDDAMNVLYRQGEDATGVLGAAAPTGGLDAVVVNA